MIYEEIKPLSKEEVEAIVDRCNPDELLYVPIAVSLYESNSRWAELVCIALSAHRNRNIRGNAILGFSHLARRFRKLNFEDVVKSLIEDGLQDADEYVRGQAECAADDVEHFLKCKINRHK